MRPRVVQSSPVVSLLALVIPLMLAAAPARAACPCSLWDPAAVPSNLVAADPNAVELGVRFSATTDGTITAIRFYKSSANGGPHVGNLWNSSGARLATITFSDETASGWQQASLSAPVAVSANSSYVVSYHTAVGLYSYDSAYFASGYERGPLRAPAGGNGVYAYGATSTFPTNSYNATNYWVDVVFQSGPADPTPPTVVGTAPAAGATGVSVRGDISVTFSKAMDPASIDATTLALRENGGSVVPASVSYDAGTLSAILRPLVLLADATTYDATVTGGAAGVRDADGLVLASDVHWSFVTRPAPAPPPDEGPGGPLLVISRSSNPFSRYYAEILAAEGFNSFTATDITNVSAATLQGRDVAILGEMRLSAGQAAMLADWVTGGGHLIAMRPDRRLAGLLGLSGGSTILSDGYVLVDGTRAPGRGITTRTMQYHGPADRYTVSGGARTVATLYSNATTTTANPAVTVRSVGSNGGQAAAFTYDLASSVVYTRQGNPAWAGLERDGSAPKRPNDLFFPDYVDLDRVAVPQADEQQRLLANIIIDMQLARRPLPRFWYLPDARKAVLVHTLDDHNTAAGTRETFEKLLAHSPAGCSVEDWQCLRATSWAYTGIALSDAEAAAYQAQGFELGVHVDTGCADWTAASLDASFAHDLQAFASTFPSARPQRTSRTHCIAWSDWATQPRVELGRGVRYDMNYYYWPGSWVAGRPGLFTGSGLPMRFADLDGTRIDVYQGASQLVNENDLAYPAAIAALIDKAQGPEGYYGAFGTHDDYRNVTFSDGLIATALAKGVAVVSAEQMLDWLDGRNASSIENIAIAGDTLSFWVSADPRARNLTVMVPAQTAAGVLAAIRRDGAGVPFTTETLKGVSYALVKVTTGAYTAQYGPSPTPTPTPTPTPASFTLWPNTTTPANTSANDPNAVQLGVRFTADVGGVIRGIRFYKGPGNSGPHIGSLWTAGGQRLAAAPFAGETAAGWQEVRFAAPVPIQPGTVYVASYHAPAGRYAYDGQYFAAPRDHAPLHALADAAGGNGVFAYGGEGAFPASSYNATNYWVDVVFEPQP